MADESQAEIFDCQTRRRPRGRRAAFITIAFAGLYLLGTHFALHGGTLWGRSWDGVQPINSTRALVSIMMPRAAVPEDTYKPGLGGLLFGAPGPGSAVAAPDPEELAAHERMKRQIAAVEVVMYGWERLMWLFCGFLAVVAVLSWVTPWGRFWHLLGALAVFVMTAVTLAGTRYIDIPDGGGFGIWPLSGRTYEAIMAGWGLPTGGGLGAPNLGRGVYLVLGGILSAYGWVLALVFLRRGREARHVDEAVVAEGT